MTSPEPDLASLFDTAERLLVGGMPEPIARAIIDLARQGAAAPRTRRGAPAPEEAEVELVTTREAAERLRVSEKQIYRLVAQGRLQRYGVGRGHRFAQADIAALLADSSARPATAADAVRAARIAAELRHSA